MAWGLPTILDRPTMTQCLPAGVDAVLFEHPHHPGGGAGLEAVLPDHQLPHVEGVEAVHILVWPDGQQDLLLVQVLGQGELHQNAVDVLPAVQGVHQLQQLLLGGLGGDGVLLAVDAALSAVLFLSVYVHPGGGVVPHQHHGQSGLALHPLHLGADLLFHLGRQGLSVHYYRCHGLLLLVIAFVVGFLLRLGLEAVHIQLGRVVGPEAVVEQDGPRRHKAHRRHHLGHPDGRPKQLQAKKYRLSVRRPSIQARPRPYQHR